MKRKIEHVYCDKCKKEIKEGETVNHEFYAHYFYDLCDDCIDNFYKFRNQVDKLKEQWEKLEQIYQYGEYLPKEKVGDIDG